MPCHIYCDNILLKDNNIIFAAVREAFDLVSEKYYAAHVAAFDYG